MTPTPRDATPGRIHRAGHVAIVGRPNTGKSTLLNRLVGQSLSIVADRAQTTRHRVLGVVTRPDAQLAFVDSPGYQTVRANPLNQILNRTAQANAEQSDVVVLVAQASPGLIASDLQVLRLVPDGCPRILVLNKLDRLPNPNAALPVIAAAAAKGDFTAIMPISATSGAGVDALVDAVAGLLPEGPPIYEAEMLTDRPERFFAAELIREKLFRLLGEELPYESTVVVDRFEQDGPVRRIDASIIVERRAHKPMVLGQGGARIKRIASEARVDMERLFDGKVFLTLWVRVRSGWGKDAAHLRSYGYE
ncbi:MAG: GTPase Era [Lautropia sp.]